MSQHSARSVIKVLTFSVVLVADVYVAINFVSDLIFFVRDASDSQYFFNNNGEFFIVCCWLVKDVCLTLQVFL